MKTPVEKAYDRHNKWLEITRSFGGLRETEVEDIVQELYILLIRNIHIHECTVTSDDRGNRGQNRTNLSSSINGMVHIRDNSVYSLKFGCLMMS